MLAGQTYPDQPFLDLIANLQKGKGKAVDPETIFASASACCAAGVVGAQSTYGANLTNEFSASLHAFLVRRWAEIYKAEHETRTDVETLRKRILDAFGAVSKAATGNPTKDGRASSYHAARKARLLIDPDEGSLEEQELTGFELLMERKYNAALAFFKSLKRNRRL